MAKLISVAEILVSNEASAVHFAACVSTPFVCISNGNHFGRFNPYPKEMEISGKYIYPAEIEKNLDDKELLEKEFRFDSNLDINTITTEKVIKVLSEFL
jgi:ADP-heptose:LPS heptosyltransferase